MTGAPTYKGTLEGYSDYCKGMLALLLGQDGRGNWKGARGKDCWATYREVHVAFPLGQALEVNTAISLRVKEETKPEI